MTTRLLLIIGATLGIACAQVSKTPPKMPSEFTPGLPVEQPLPFSHKSHVALGVTCLDCHAIQEPGDFAGLPPLSKCMLCHVSVKTESPHVKQLTELAAAGKEPAWKRVYQVEEFVYFSHEAHHREAGVACAVCHGEVEKREILFQERPVRMYACMQCHEKYEAPNHCELCHDTH